MTVVDERANLRVDGLPPIETATPESAAELASILARFAAVGATVVPFGGATALGLGNVPEGVDLALDTRGLARVLAYEPADLTLSVEAGASLAAIQSLLAERGQELPIDVAFPARATIGGVIATGFAGPRRLSDGTVRDLLIGASFARTDGTVAKSGGLVVKNVSGFDLPRLMHGALGTLGVLTSVNLKILPAAKVERTMLLYGDPAPLTALAVAVCGLPLRPTAVELTLSSKSALIALRVRGRARGVEEQVREIEARIRGHDLTVTEDLTDEDSAAWWQQLVDHWATERDDVVQFLLRMRPRQMPDLVRRLQRRIEETSDASAVCSIGLGLARLNLPVPASNGAEWLKSCQKDWLCDVEDAVVQFAPPAAKRGLDIWGKPASGVSVMRALKAEFDPTGALNRGRFMDFI